MTGAVRYWFRWPLLPVLGGRRAPDEWSAWHIPLGSGDWPACGTPGPHGAATGQIEKALTFTPTVRCQDCFELVTARAER